MAHSSDSLDSDQDDAWLVGFKSKLDAFSLDYNYRDIQRNAVVGAFTDSDFANGTTGPWQGQLGTGFSNGTPVEISRI